jgi:ATP-dependent DNA helicase DinG
MGKLKNWAVIDLETTGISPGVDDIIDVGFLAFEGTKLIREYSSLVHSEQTLTPFIQKLTGITPNLIKKAPTWKNVEQDVQELGEFHLLAHNASFEKGFLTATFDKISANPFYQDSILYLAFLNPHLGSLSLENIILELKIAEKEDHRGLSDSLNLLKVLLLQTYLSHQHKPLYVFFKTIFANFTDEEFWFKNFYSLTDDELFEIAGEIKFDLLAAVEKYKNSKNSQDSNVKLNNNWDFNSDNIQNILSNEKEIKEIIPHFKTRKGQINLALKVGQALKNKIHAIIQAPTGTGKTIGYLIPSFLFAKKEKQKVLISTGTKALQNQALTKDIPQALNLLGMSKTELNITKLIGSSNHFCELLYRNDHKGIDWADTFEMKFAKIFFDFIFFMNSLGETFITKEDFPFILQRLVPGFKDFLTQYKVDYRSCSGHLCPFKNQCSYYSGLKAAKTSDIIVANHALTFYWPQSIEKPTHIIIDEAHKIESEATKAYTLSLSSKDLAQLGSHILTYSGPLFYLLGQDHKEEKISELRKFLSDGQTVVEEHIEDLADLIPRSFLKSPQYSSQYWNEKPMIKSDGLNDGLATSIRNRLESLDFVLDNIFQKLFFEGSNYLEKNNDEENFVTAKTSFQNFLTQLDDGKKVISLLLKTDQEWCRSIKYLEEEGYILEVSPINIGQLIHDNLLKASDSVIFTSATLANAKGTSGIQGMEWLTGYSYLPPEKRFKSALFLEPVFDYANKAKVLICQDVPGINAPDYIEKIITPFKELLHKKDGRALFLFSSKVRFEKATQLLLQEFEGKLPLFIQGIGNNVVEEFKKTKHGILVGMESFSEGIDIPGETLQLVFVDKIPDIRMDQVIQMRRDFFDKNFGNEFVDYFLAHRTQYLQQKLGRLIRSETDSGVIVIFDSRMKQWKKNTLESFKVLMEPYKIEFVSLDDATKIADSFIN